MMKVVLKVEISDAKTKKKVLRAVSGLLGIVSMTADTKENKITVIGTTDPVEIVRKVKKICCSAYIISVGPEKEEPQKKDPKIEEIDWVNKANYYQTFPYYYPTTTQYYYPICTQEQYNPNSSCVIS